MAEFNDLFTGGFAFDPDTRKFKKLVKKLQQRVKFPLPIVTGSSREGTIDLTLIHRNSLVEDQFIADFIRETLEQGWLKVVIKEREYYPEVIGTQIFSEYDFIRANWKDDAEKQDLLL